MGDRSAHNERGGAGPPARTPRENATSEALVNEDGGQVEFRFVPGEGRAGQTECIFLLSFSFSFV